jgi:hypothetical protein
MRLGFTVRDLLWLTLVAALAGASTFLIAADEPAPTGTLKGRFIYNGSAPQPAVVVPNVNPQVFGKFRIIDESLLVPRLGVQNVFIWVRSKDIPIPAHDKLDAVAVEFKEGRFVPHALAFQVPRDLVLKNGDDSVACNFRGDLTNNPPFNVTMPVKQQKPMDIEGSEAVPASLQSSLYPWVKCWILPLPHPYFAVSDEAGEFQIENLPPGNWEFQVWHERNGNLETADWKRGRFSLEIKPGVNHMGFIKFDPKLFEKK